MRASQQRNGYMYSDYSWNTITTHQYIKETRKMQGPVYICFFSDIEGETTTDPQRYISHQTQHIQAKKEIGTSTVTTIVTQ